MISPLNVPNGYRMALGFLEECDLAYSSLSIKDLIVVDLGADFGSSTYWFLQKGASKVIAFESDSQYNVVLKQLAYGDPRVEVFGEWTGEYIPGDILKMDIEGGERLLTQELLERYPQFAIAIHHTLPESEYKRLETMLEAHGGKISYKTGDGIEVVYVKSL